MPQRDFILRQIEMLGAALAAIRKMILGGKGEASEVESRLQSVSQTGGMALDLARAASPDTIQMLIAPTGGRWRPSIGARTHRSGPPVAS